MIDTILDYLRIALYVVLAFLGVILYQAWSLDHPKQDIPQAKIETTFTMPSTYVPEVKSIAEPTISSPSLPTASTGKLIHVTTDTLNVTLDTHGGDIVGLKLLKYPERLDSNTPFILLNDEAKTQYIAESGLLSKIGPDTSKGQAIYTTKQTEYALSNNENTLLVTLYWQDNQGLKITKTFTFTRNSYEINVAYNVDNQTKQSWQGHLYTQLMRTNAPSEHAQGLANLSTYFGAAISSPQKPFQKITFKDMQESSVNQVIKGGWAAMVQHYFISAWIPHKDTTLDYYSKVTTNGLYTIGMIGPELIATPGSSITTQATLYSGPALTDKLKQAAPGLQLTIDYGIFWFISGILFWMMQKIYDLVGNWGWSIIFVTIIIKLLFYHLSSKSYRSMSAMKKLQPRIEALKERYKDDKQKFTQATLDLYRQEKVNPMSGCLPILIQIPVFIALYWVLVESVQLRQAPFMLWIQDLSLKDPYYILPLLMGVSMYLQQRLNPPPPDPLQAKVMMFMPVIFTVLFLNFPSGLMLYWFVNNTLSFLQQWYIMHKMDKEERVKKAKG
ncbi:MAG: membrane protein insertase YidC [Gammaproteobacteria bacterium RIFCSPHIGHO2_12_FULL_41_20]|nr:MAG: membrane protein insertase YidC [Gammaproteobacteria bacterium RIFCSPHIGHO2_12_FULL_41_20]